MSLLPSATFSAPGVPLYGSGGGSGSNITVSTIFVSTIYVSTINTASNGSVNVASNSITNSNSGFTGNLDTLVFSTPSLNVINNGGFIPSYTDFTTPTTSFEIAGGLNYNNLMFFSTIVNRSYLITLNVQTLSNAGNDGFSILGVKGNTGYETYFGRWKNADLSNDSYSGSPSCYFIADSSNARIFGLNSSASVSTIFTTTTSLSIQRLK
jgi:hypothetical protein